jgi:predicted RNA-binding protein YlxR (DUF448 family)
VGCRSRGAKSDLLRVVAVDGALLPDPMSRQPGRGAYVHPSPDCVAAAERRRAFGRALRVTVALDSVQLRRAIEQVEPDSREVPGEADDDSERSMSQHR